MRRRISPRLVREPLRKGLSSPAGGSFFGILFALEQKLHLKKEKMMKNGLAALLLFLLSCFFSCQKDTEEKVYGKWLLEKIVRTDGQVEPVDTVWYNFQTTLFLYQIYEPSRGGYRNSYGLATFESDDRITLELQNDPGMVADFLPYTDWTSGIRTFTVVRLKGKDLTLESDGKQYIFRKY